MSELLTLKWGTVKGWKDMSEGSQKLLEKFFADGVSMSCAMDKPDEEQKSVLCDLIDQLDGKIYLDWDGKYVSKKEAKKYILEYGKDA